MLRRTYIACLVPFSITFRWAVCPRRFFFVQWIVENLLLMLSLVRLRMHGASVLYLRGLVLKHQYTNYRRQYRSATNAPKLLAVIRAKIHLAPCCTVPSTPIEFVELDLWLHRIVAFRVWNNIWLKFIHEETLTKSALSGILHRIISFLITPGIESLRTEYKLLCFHRE